MAVCCRLYHPLLYNTMPEALITKKENVPYTAQEEYKLVRNGDSGQRDRCQDWEEGGCVAGEVSYPQCFVS